MRPGARMEYLKVVHIRYKRASKKEKSLWNEYPDYTPINNIDEKPLFDETRVGDEHRVLGQIIRENWHLIHPLARDYMLSSASEWRKANSSFSSASRAPARVPSSISSTATISRPRVR